MKSPTKSGRSKESRNGLKVRQPICEGGLKNSYGGIFAIDAQRSDKIQEKEEK